MKADWMRLPGSGIRQIFLWSLFCYIASSEHPGMNIGIDHASQKASLSNISLRRGGYPAGY
jgi:hypothetical protein